MRRVGLALPRAEHLSAESPNVHAVASRKTRSAQGISRARASSRETNRPPWTFGSTGARVTGPAAAVKTTWKFRGYGYGYLSGRGPSFRSSKNPIGRGSPTIEQPTSSPISRDRAARRDSVPSRRPPGRTWGPFSSNTKTVPPGPARTARADTMSSSGGSLSVRKHERKSGVTPQTTYPVATGVSSSISLSRRPMIRARRSRRSRSGPRRAARARARQRSRSRNASRRRG